MAVGTIEKVIKRFASGKHDSPTLSVGVRWDGQRDTELQLYKTGLAGKYELVLSSSVEGAKMEQFFSSLAAGGLQEGPKTASQEEERGGVVEEVEEERKASFSTAVGLEKDLGFCPSPSKADRRMRRAASGAENAGIVNEQGGDEERLHPGSEKKGGGVDGQAEGSGSLWRPGSFSLRPHNKEPTQIQVRSCHLFMASPSSPLPPVAPVVFRFVFARHSRSSFISASHSSSPSQTHSF